MSGPGKEAGPPSSGGPPAQQGPQQKKPQAYKLLLDPFLVKGATKLYRFEGHVPDDPTYPPVTVRDPRPQISLSRMWSRLDGMELPIPRFKIDANYVGNPPPLEVSISNLNDNVDKPFLFDLLLKFGPLEDLYIYYHPRTNRHLGLARIIFETVKAAKTSVSKLHNSPLMGNVLDVFLDPFGTKIKSMYEEMITEKPVELPKKVEDKRKGTDSDSMSIIGYQTPAQTPQMAPTPLQIQLPPLSTPQKVSQPIHINQILLGHPRQESLQQNHKQLSLIPTPVPPPPQISIPCIPQQSAYEPVEETSPKMDLDTRIKLLLKSKQGTEFGKFLGVGFDPSDSEEDDKPGKPKRGLFTIKKRKTLCIRRSEIWKTDSDEDSPPRQKKRLSRDDSLSPPPSPFLRAKGQERRQNNGLRHSLMTNELDEVSDESDKEHGKPKQKNQRSPDSDDPSRIQLPPEPPPSFPFPHLPLPFQVPMGQFFPSNQIPQMDFSQQLHPSGPAFAIFQQQPPPYSIYPPQWGPPGGPQFQHQQMSYPPQGPLPYYSQPHPYPSTAPPPPPEVPQLSPKSELRESTQGILKAVFQRLIRELRLILRRDFDRRLIENSSFRSFEIWWTDMEKAYKEMSQMREKEKRRQMNDGMNGNMEMTITCEGLGFRAIPKLPSFKIQKKAVTPPPEVPVKEEEVKKTTQESDDGENSDYEIGRKPKILRRLSLSSESELSSSGLSESESEESDSSSPELSTKNSEEEKPKAVTKPDDLWVESISEDEPYTPGYKPSTPTNVDKDESVSKALKTEQLLKVEIKKMEEDESGVEDMKPIGLNLGSRSPFLPFEIPVEQSSLHLDDHNYCLLTPPSPGRDGLRLLEENFAMSHKPPMSSPPRRRKKTSAIFPKRTKDEETSLLTDFLMNGIDSEDIKYIKEAYEIMKKDEVQKWVSRAHWVDHAPTKILPPKVSKSNRRVHKSGAARTEGFYKLSPEERLIHKLQWATVTCAEYKTPGTLGAVGVTALAHHQDKNSGKSQVEKSREARSQQRRLLTAFGTDVTSTSDLLRFNQLKFRKKNLRFQRSTIHDWGLFAAEPIAADEMVIEYVGQTIRPHLADTREKKYGQVGIGSSYLFKVDIDNVIDATKCGNLSRFINHSCTPNCYAKVITIEGEKKIVIYSKQAIAVNEEITYDYKFPLEKVKIPCLCGTSQCRGYLN